MAKICLLAPGQLSIDPRLVKEADALHEAEHEVQVLCAHYVEWADETDRQLLESRGWGCTYVGGNPNRSRGTYAWGRFRHGLLRRVPWHWRLNSGSCRWAVSRVLPELQAAAMRTTADLYIGHYPAGLVAAVNAARRRGALAAFDAEDFETGSWPLGGGPSKMDRLVERFEREYLPQCSYVTAASPGIAEAYTVKYGIPLPTTILNVFPLAERPRELRVMPTDGPLRLYWFSQTIGLGRGLEDVISAMGQLKGCRIELHLRGRWASGHHTLLFELAASAGIRSEQIVAYSPSGPDQMARLASEFDVGLALEQPVSQNRQICLTNKIFTYILAGNAVIATATRGQRPIMETIGDAGYSYEPGDVNALTRGLRFWYENRNILQQARQKSWDWGTSRFNWDFEKKKLVQQVEAILHDRPLKSK
jgi:glycosyltransferase involved in cell wall biosynthesis